MKTPLGQDRAGLPVIVIHHDQDRLAIVDHRPLQAEARDQYVLVVLREVAHPEGLLRADLRQEDLVLEGVTSIKNEKNYTTDRNYLLFRY